jgi:phosphoribosylglycinamide formyltransferase 1
MDGSYSWSWRELMKNIAIFISGRGSNLESILKKWNAGFFDCSIPFVLSNKKDILGLQVAKKYNIPSYVVDLKSFPTRKNFEDEIMRIVKFHSIDVIVLAGFMTILSSSFIETFAKPIINIHPSLLPSFPGLNAQRRTLDYGSKFAGCTVHFVTSNVDGGPIILQDVIPVFDDDTEETLTMRILEREHLLIPEALKIIVEDRYHIIGRRLYIKK